MEIDEIMKMGRDAQPWVTAKDTFFMADMVVRLWTTYELFQSTWKRLEKLVSRIDSRMN